MGFKMFGGLTLKQLTLRVWKEANEDNVFGGAAELAYYFLLALFPMLIFLTSLVGFLPGLQANILSALAKVAPADAMKLVEDTLADVISHRSGGLLSFGVLGTLWAASSGVESLMGTLNVAYEAKEKRSFWKVRLVAIILTASLALLVIGGAAFVMFGHKLSDWLSELLGFGTAFTIIGSIVGYIIGMTLLFLGIQLLYYFGPDVKQEWKWITPGAVFAVVAILVGSFLFSLYLRVAPSNSATYGSLGAVITLMLWLYLIGLAFLVGGEINSEIEKGCDKPTAEKQKAGELQVA
ncbi:MAG TPA: YihY/virulence factor BrkB family protein [Blastocatellia bacterium]|nr:YihY/virulence factor BrkB family protein [Blastocatellia bacterium]